jgi:hypothetical protein
MEASGFQQPAMPQRPLQLQPYLHLTKLADREVEVLDGCILFLVLEKQNAGVRLIVIWMRSLVTVPRSCRRPERVSIDT